MNKQIFILVITALLASVAFAQSNISTSVESKYIGNSQRGFQVGIEYINLTDQQWEDTTSFGGETRHEKGAGGMQAGVGGLRLGYNQTPEKGFGFNGALVYLETINKSEVGEKLVILLPQGNLTYGMNRYLMGYAGLNVSVFSQNNRELEYYNPSVGAQFGFGVRATKNILVHAGYAMMRQQHKMDFGNGYSTEGYTQFSGFNSNISYVF